MGEIYKGDIKGDVVLTNGDDASKLTSVGGGLYISAEGAQLPVLTSVGGGLCILAEGAQLPVLTSVGADRFERVLAVARHMPQRLDAGQVQTVGNKAFRNHRSGLAGSRLFSTTSKERHL